MTLLKELKQKIDGSKVSVRRVCREAGIPESTYYRAMERESCTMAVYEAIKSAFKRLSKKS